MSEDRLRLARAEQTEALLEAERRDNARWRLENDRLRHILNEARQRMVTFAGMVEDISPYDPEIVQGQGRLTVQIQDHLTNIVVTNVVMLPFRPRGWDDADRYLEDMLAHTSDVVAREYSYAIAGASI